MFGKREARSLVRTHLAALTQRARAEKSARIRERITALDGWDGARCVGLFAALADEPDLLPLLAAHPAKRFCFPRVNGGALDFYAVKTETALVAGRWGVREPPADAASLVPPSDLDVLCVPGVAFTPDGHRLGRGGGFYDRYLARPGLRALTVGVCFAEQVLAGFETHGHDRPVQVVVSDGIAAGQSAPACIPGAAGPRHRRRCRAVWLIAVCVVGLALGVAGWHWTRKRPLAPAGGLWFPVRKVLAVPPFRQNAEPWRNDRLGWTDGTLGAEGCAVVCAAMVLRFYGVDTDPRRLNWHLAAHGGYTDQGWIYWERAADLAPDRVRHVYEDLPSYFLIDWNLLRGNPVIVRLRYPGGVTHFVVIVGKEGFDYLVRDPGAGAARGVYPLREFGSPIEALRYYRCW